MPKLQTLTLEITQTITNSRSREIEKLAERLNKVKDAINGLSNVDAAAQSIGNLATAAGNMNSSAGSANALAKSLKAITTAASNAGKVAQSIGQLSAVFQGVSQAADAIDASAMRDVAEAAAMLKSSGSGLASFGRAIDSIGTSMQEVEVKAGRFEMFIYGLNEASEAIDMSKFEKILTLGAAMKEAASGIRGFANGLGKLAEIASSPEGVANVLQLIDDMVNKLTERQEDLLRMADAFTAIAQGLRAIDKAGDVGKKIDDINKSMHQGFKAALKFAAGILSIPLKSFGDKISGVVAKFHKLMASIVRIAFYRAIRSLIRSITSGFSEGLKHVYQWAQIVGDQFKSSMDSMATSAHYVRDSLGAMASPLIDALAPAVEFLVDKFVNLLNIVNQFIATFTGATSWRRAVRTPTEYSGALVDAADSAGKMSKNTKAATEAQKKLNKAIMDFDELHLLTTSTTGGSDGSSPKPSTGSGAGSGGIDATHFVEEPIADWIQAIKDAIDRGDWYGAGALLADKLNGIIEQWDAKAWGEKLGQKVENGLQFYLGFMKTFKWDQLGIKSGDFINGILSKIDPKDLGEAMVAHIKAALKFLSNFTWTVDLTSLGAAFGVAFNELFSKETMTDLGKTISGVINDAVDIAYGFVKTADFGQMGRGIMEAIFTAIKTIKWEQMGDTVASLATGLIDAIISAIDYALHNMDKILIAIGQFVAGILKHLWEWLIEKTSGLIKDFLAFVEDQLFGGNSDDGNNRKDSYGSSTLLPTSNTPTTSETTQNVKINMDKNSSDTMDKITEMNKALNKMGNTTYTPTVKVTSEGISGIQKALENITKKSWTGKLKVKPVLTTKSGTKTVETAMTLKQFNKTYELYTPQLKASGGFPDLSQGSMFVAGEVPGQAEMVGNIHGKTGVASGKEITGIADAVYNTGEAEASLLKEQNRLLRQLLAKKSEVTLAPNAAAGRWVNQSQAAYARATGG